MAQAYQINDPDGVYFVTFATVEWVVSSLIKVVQSEELILTIDMSNLSNGIYIVKTKTTFNKVYKQ